MVLVLEPFLVVVVVIRDIGGNPFSLFVGVIEIKIFLFCIDAGCRLFENVLYLMERIGMVGSRRPAASQKEQRIGTHEDHQKAGAHDCAQRKPHFHTER